MTAPKRLVGLGFGSQSVDAALVSQVLPSASRLLAFLEGTVLPIKSVAGQRSPRTEPHDDIA